MTRKTYCGNLLWQSSLSLLRHRRGQGVQAEALEVTVQDVNGIDYSDEFTAVVVNDRLLLKNAHPSGITFFFR